MIECIRFVILWNIIFVTWLAILIAISSSIVNISEKPGYQQRIMHGAASLVSWINKPGFGQRIVYGATSLVSWKNLIVILSKNMVFNL